MTINEDSSVQVLAEEAHPVDRLDAAVSTLLFPPMQITPVYGIPHVMDTLISSLEKSIE